MELEDAVKKEIQPSVWCGQQRPDLLPARALYLNAPPELSDRPCIGPLLLLKVKLNKAVAHEQEAVSAPHERCIYAGKTVLHIHRRNSPEGKIRFQQGSALGAVIAAARHAGIPEPPVVVGSLNEIGDVCLDKGNPDVCEAKKAVGNFAGKAFGVKGNDAGLAGRWLVGNEFVSGEKIHPAIRSPQGAVEAAASLKGGILAAPGLSYRIQLLRRFIIAVAAPKQVGVLVEAVQHSRHSLNLISWQGAEGRRCNSIERVRHQFSGFRVVHSPPRLAVVKVQGPCIHQGCFSLNWQGACVLFACFR